MRAKASDVQQCYRPKASSDLNFTVRVPPGVVFALADATVRTTLPNGTVVAYPAHAGDVLWRDAVTHSAENVGATEAHYYAVELKDASR